MTPHIEEDQTKPVCFMKKKLHFFLKIFLNNLRFKIFAITTELHCNGKNLKSQTNQHFLDLTDFFSSNRLD